VLLRVDHDVYAMPNSLDQHGADATLAQPDHWVGCLHQGVLISPTSNYLYFNTCNSATVLHTLLQCGRFVFGCFEDIFARHIAIKRYCDKKIILSHGCLKAKESS